ncbi:ATPase [Paenibacillus albiflavus]|uniref:Nuclease SbcCD subunit C n=1 Tax=Paenibacillus albiflavus TaxID=2545760 RepID=A0A4V2WNM8_9BACL|nr:AAA family ATPase [Paenibacillus albiflavus]TCZ76072.1 ATPase [Paenibacillus albiflavus]
MIIKFLSLTLHNFKSHRDLHVKFGDLTKITGENAKGKSSILEAISFTLYGTDVLGSKTDPTPTNYEYDFVRSDLLLSIDDKQVLLGRGIEKGKNTFYINEVPSKATEFDELVKSLFDKDLFLSLFNPSYFFTLNWTEQRALLLKYASAPTSKEVFAEMSRTSPEQKLKDITLNPAAEKLAELTKKHSLSDLDKIHRDNKNKQDKAYIAEQSRTKTLQEQLERYPAADIDVDATVNEKNRLIEQIKEIEETTTSADVTNRQINTLNAQIQSLQERISASATKWPALKDEPIQDTCRTCKQPLDESAIADVTADKEQRKAQYQANHKALVNQRKELEAELAGIQYIDVSVQLEKIRELDHQMLPLSESIKSFDQRLQLLGDIDQAKANEAATHKSLNESIFILDAIKAFAAKEAELQAAKVQSLFSTLSIRLFETLKNGEIKSTFEIEMDDKVYRKLSLSEGIRAGLELRDVLSEQSGIVAPCFVDNAESITRFKQPNGQLITARVVSEQELNIISEGIQNESN